MNKTLLIAILNVLLISGSSFAGGTEQNQAQNSQQAQKQNQSQFTESSANNHNEVEAGSWLLDESSQTIDIDNPQQKVQPFSPGLVNIPFMFPQEYDFWNGYGSDMSDYERVWCRKELEYILRQVRERGPIEELAAAVSGGAKNGFGFKKQNAALRPFKGCKKNEIELRFLPLVPNAKDSSEMALEKVNSLKVFRAEVRANYNFAGEFCVRGHKDDRLIIQTLAYALLQALNSGADFVVCSPGLNPVYHGNSSAGATGAGGAGVQNSYSLLGSLAQSDAKVIAESIIRISYYQKKSCASSVPAAAEVEKKPSPAIKEKKTQPKIKEPSELSGPGSVLPSIEIKAKAAEIK